MNWPYRMDLENFYVFRYNEPMRYFEVKAIPMAPDVLEPTYYGKDGYQLLDEITLNCTSEEDLFDTIMRCVSPSGFLGGKSTVDSLKDSFIAKRRFFASLREDAEKEGISLCQYVSVSGEDYHYTIGDVLAAFNLKSVALLSLPAYAAMDFNGKAMPIAPDDPEHGHVACPLHDFMVPGMQIWNFEDYFEAFAQGAFAGNNSDLFVTLYGLAYAIDVFVNQTNWDGFRCFEDVIGYEPLTRTLNALVRMGALHSPFDKSATWKCCPSGIENARDVCPDLAGTLEIARAMTPIGLLSPFARPDVMQVFYGLINHFSSCRDYFGIDWGAHFEFPTVEERFVSHADDNGPFLRWESFTRRFDDSVGARAKILGTDEYAEYIPGKDAAPVFKYTEPSGSESFRMVWSLLWNVPETSVESENGTIQVKGLRQLIASVDVELVDVLEREAVYGKEGVLMARLGDVEEFLKDRPQTARELSSALGVSAHSNEASCHPRLEPIYHSGDFVGFGCLAPNGFNQINWLPNRFKCPITSCLSPDGLRSSDCYVWDMPEQTLTDGEGATHIAAGLKQMCEANCPELLDEFQKESFTFYGVSVIPYSSADDKYFAATGVDLRQKPRFL